MAESAAAQVRCCKAPFTNPPVSGSQKLGCRKWGCNKWGFKGYLAALEIGQNRPFSPFFCLFHPFPEGEKSTWEIQKTKEKGLFLQISSDLLKPPSLKPPFAAPPKKYPLSLRTNWLMAQLLSLFSSFGYQLGHQMPSSGNKSPSEG